MTDTTEPTALLTAIDLTARDARVRKRHRAELRFRGYGIFSIGVAVAALLWLFTSLAVGGAGAVYTTYIKIDVHLDQTVIDPDATGDAAVFAKASYQSLIRSGLRNHFPGVTGRRDQRALNGLVTLAAPYLLRDIVLDDPALIGTKTGIWILASDEADLIARGKGTKRSTKSRNDGQAAWIAELRSQDRVERRFNWQFFTGGDSREPELAGILVAMIGSVLSLLVCFAVAFPVGVLAAVYLQEFARRTWITTLFEVNINNLAAVPSIIFGLLGLYIFLNVLHLPRSAPLVGGLVLALMTLPTIIIASRAALQSVPESIRDGALAVGASRVQAIFHHVVPIALPGMMTGTILGMARALGETAPLLMIGMVAFIVDVPKSILDPATALPVQIFLWADSPERAFVDKTSAAILVLLGFMVLMNAGAVLIRNRFEVRL
jgi:phosphate transport system permease protein